MNDDGLLLIVKNEREVRAAEKLGLQATSDRDALGRWQKVLLDGLIAITRSSVKFIRLPNARSLSAWTGTREELLQLVAEAPDWEPKEIQDAKMIPTSDEDDGGPPEKTYPQFPYFVMDGRICFGKQLLAGLEVLCLCNFNCQIVEELVTDDGNDTIQTVRTYRIEGTLATGEKLPTAFVPAGQFRSMNWVDNQWGAKANISAGNNSRDKLREAIKELSDSSERRTYCHSGWRMIDSSWFYLTHGGAIGADGFTNKLDVDLGELRAYTCGTPPQFPENAREAMETSLRLLDVASLSVTAPIWAAIFRAPLAHAQRPDFTLWLEAPTGKFKSTLAALFLRHYGKNFDTNRLPGSWRSTANSLEKHAHLLKDTVFVIDDYSHDDHSLHARAADFCRAQGNLSGRGRLSSNLVERRAFQPRGITISTGELHPSGERSLLARIPIVEVSPGAVDVELLTEAQMQADVLSSAMAGYLQWLAQRFDVVIERLPEEFRAARSLTTTDGQLRRISESLANLWLGLDYGLRYAQDVGAIADDDAAALRKRCLSVFLDLGKMQDRLVQGEQPIRRFWKV